MEIKDVMHRLRNYCEKQDFAGWDPYDALNSPLMKALKIRS